ncbi:MAG TPA: hypothetical protein DC046_08085 [Rhodospirillaceae bacterium]|nr:hypothetical protein [Rhodospirillaceae bacterium]
MAVQTALETAGRTVVVRPTDSEDQMSPVHWKGVELLVDLSERGAGIDLAERLGVPVWLLCHGPKCRFDLSNSIKSGFLSHEPFIEIRLVEWRAGDDSARSLRRHCLRRRKTPDRSVSAVKNAAADWFGDALLSPRIQSDGDDQRVTPTSGTAPAPWRLQIATLTNIAAMAIDLFTAEEWNVGTVMGDPAQVFDRDFMSRVNWLPRNRTLCFRADPFGWRTEQGETVLLYETFDYRKGKGRIVRNVNGTEDVIGDFSYHASYPYLIEKDGQHYAVPELSEMACPTAFPVDRNSPQWVGDGCPLKGLEGVPLSDGTIFLHEGRYWLFGMKADQESNAMLHAWHAPDCFGPWTPHERNPIKIDITSSRPGGTPFLWQDQLVRPTQDCSTTYGAAIVLNRIDILTPTKFGETPIARIEPDPTSYYRHGVHTLNVIDGIIIVDAKRHARHLLAPLYRWLRVCRSKRRAIVPS